MGNKKWIFLILLLATTLRFVHLSFHDSYTDEAILAFRAIGLIDYDGSLIQTTPWQWVPVVPWWAHLSFHDHPVVFFLLQHAAMRVFGENLFAVRLPSVLAGIASVALLFFIAKRLFDERTGFIAAALLAVSSYHLWVSRLGIQDGVIIAILLLILFLLFKTKEDARYWILVGAALGIGIITKYTIFIAFPIIALFGMIYRVPLIKSRFFWYGVFVMVLFASPSWIYNLMLYRTFGHFDFQISGFLGQEVAEWRYRMGRAQVGELTDRFHNFFLALLYANSQWFNALTGISIVAALSFWWKKRSPALLFLLGCTILIFLWFFVLGSTYRFVVMILPFFILLISVMLSRAPRSFVFVFFTAELLFSMNTFFLPQPVGPPLIAYANIREETEAYGFQTLDAYLGRLLSGRVSALFGSPAYQFLTDLQNRRIQKLKASGAVSYPIMIIYDHDMNFVANLWLFQRRIIYSGWPILPDDDFLTITGDERELFFRRQGIEEFLYIATLREEVRNAPSERVGKRDTFVPYLLSKGILPEIIADRWGTPAFAVYHF